MNVSKYSLDELYQMVMDNKIYDAKTAIAILKAKAILGNALMTMFFVLYINRMYSGGDMMKRKICFIFELLLKICDNYFRILGSVSASKR